MSVKSRVVFENQHYVVCLTRAGLSSQNKHTGRGRCLIITSPELSTWLEAFDTAVDRQESHNLAKAIATV